MPNNKDPHKHINIDLAYSYFIRLLKAFVAQKQRKIRYEKYRKLYLNSKKKRILRKSNFLPIGTVHVWQDGKQHRKTADGWIEVAESDVQTGTFNGEIQTLYDKRKFALIKQNLFGGNQPTNKELAQMAGSHKDEKVTFTPTDKGIKIFVYHADYTCDSLIIRDVETKELIISMGKLAKRKEASTGLGFQILLNQILSGTKFGISYISAKAIRSANMNGYYTWARYGFNGILPNSNILFRKFKSIFHIMSTSEGRRLWRFLGTTFEAKFDLQEIQKVLRCFINT
ncbi:MAG: hypothetical protein KBF93_06940 [Leptospiraceae bacterium]|nr:hypothetical protein [Leptospiraceae bacterium]